MGNASELLINVVMIRLPKLLLGNNQKVRGRLSLSIMGIRRLSTTGE